MPGILNPAITFLAPTYNLSNGDEKQPNNDEYTNTHHFFPIFAHLQFQSKDMTKAFFLMTFLLFLAPFLTRPALPLRPRFPPGSGERHPHLHLPALPTTGRTAPTTGSTPW